MNDELNNLCLCGHRWQLHSHAKYPMPPELTHPKNTCYGSVQPSTGFLCECQDFKQDNLAYLKAKYELRRA